VADASQSCPAGAKVVDPVRAARQAAPLAIDEVAEARFVKSWAEWVGVCAATNDCSSVCGLSTATLSGENIDCLNGYIPASQKAGGFLPIRSDGVTFTGGTYRTRIYLRNDADFIGSIPIPDMSLADTVAVMLFATNGAQEKALWAGGIATCNTFGWNSIYCQRERRGAIQRLSGPGASGAVIGFDYRGVLLALGATFATPDGAFRVEGALVTASNTDVYGSTGIRVSPDSQIIDVVLRSGLVRQGP